MFGCLQSFRRQPKALGTSQGESICTDWEGYEKGRPRLIWAADGRVVLGREYLTARNAITVRVSLIPFLEIEKSGECAVSFRERESFGSNLVEGHNFRWVAELL